MIKPILIKTDKSNYSVIKDFYINPDKLVMSQSHGYKVNYYHITLIDTETEIVEGDNYLHKETFLDGIIKTQEQFDNANWAIDVCKKGDIPYIERARNGKNVQKGLSSVFKIISSTNKAHNLPQLSEQSIQLLINYYNEHKCMPESVEVEYEKDGYVTEWGSGFKGSRCQTCNKWFYENAPKPCNCQHIKLNQQGKVDITISNNSQIFTVILETSNNNIEEVRQKLEGNISNWLDNASFISGKDEICKSVDITIPEDKKLYTEEEVRALFIKRSDKFSTGRTPFNELLIKQDLDWFEQNKK